MKKTLHKKTKIIATVGPSLATPQKLLQAILHGANVFRINFSHGEVGEHSKMIEMIRQVASRVKRPIGILADLPGPKLRIGSFKKNEPVLLVRGQTMFGEFSSHLFLVEVLRKYDQVFHHDLAHVLIGRR